MVGLNDGLGSLYGADGTPGFLLEATAYGSGSFSAVLDSATFADAAGWSLDFQLGLTGFDAYGSFVRLGNVTLEARGSTEPPVAPIPEPGTLLLLGSGLLGLARLRRKP
ncbi:MAG: PEP-CTERM sorting domain-containing protein [Deferrisomatales bacterium]